MAMTSIWRDKWVELPSAAAYPFRIKDGDGNVIYTGTAVAQPGAVKTRVRVNDVCADAMGERALPSGGLSGFIRTGEVAAFSLEYYAGGAWTQAEEWEFLADWSYRYEYDPEYGGLSFPVVRRVTEDHLFVGIATTDAEVTGRVLHEDPEDTEEFSYEVGEEGELNVGLLVIDFADFSGGARALELDGIGTWEIVGCRRYALHYVNAYGGWDTFVPAAFEKMKDAYKRSEIRVGYDNGDVRNGGVRDIGNEVTRTIAFRTGTLTDAQAARMHHLLGSPCLYLEDREGEDEDGTFIPVRMKETACEYRTFRNSGGKRVEYTFTVEVAKDMIRR